MLFRTLTLIAGLVTIFSAQASFFNSSSNFLSSTEGSVTDYFRLISDNASEIKFSPIKSILYSNTGFIREEHYLAGPLKGPIARNFLELNWIKPTGGLILDGTGSFEMSYRKQNATPPFYVNFGKIIVAV